jgi:hypothetical protein
MYPLNDKDLDRLSRDAAEHYDVESSASGWERLESRLDKELPVKEKDRRRFLFWLFLVGLLTGGGLIYMLGGSPRDNLASSGKNEAGKVGRVPASEIRAADSKAEDRNVASQSKPPSNAATPRGDVSDNSQGKQPVDDNNVVTTPKTNNNPSPLTDKAKADPKKLSDNNTIVRNQPAGNINKPRRNDRGIVAGISSDGTKKGKQPKDKTIKPANDDNADRAVVQNDKQDNNNDVIDAQKNDSQKTNVTVPDTKTATDSATKTEDVSKTDSSSNKPAETASTQKPKTSKYATPLSKWEFGVTAGPDFSNVGFKHGYTTGWNIGATVGYRISDRWLLNTGLIYTKKFYKVDGGDFYPPKHSPMSYLDVDNVSGSCNMFEIPVNIRYDISYNKKGRFFANTGLSSYIMDKQDYVCTYYNNQGELVDYPWKTDDNWDHFLSNLNLSIGYERTVGKNFSVQAEPYFKVPLQGLGYGSIRMNSYGMLFTLKYKPSAKPKK